MRRDPRITEEATSFSRSSRRRSSAGTSQLRTLRRSAGGAASEVTMAASTSTVYPVSLTTPRLKPTMATTMPMAPRALSPAPSTMPSRWLTPPRRAPR